MLADNSGELIEAILKIRPFNKSAQELGATHRREGCISPNARRKLKDLWSKISDERKIKHGFEPGEWK